MSTFEVNVEYTAKEGAHVTLYMEGLPDTIFGQLDPGIKVTFIRHEEEGAVFATGFMMLVLIKTEDLDKLKPL